MIAAVAKQLPDWRSAVTTMAAVLGSWLSSWGVAELWGLAPAATNVLAVAMALTLSRVVARPSVHRHLGWARVLVLPCVGIGASLIGSLIQHHPDVGDTVFVLILAGAVWGRRFGPLPSALGTIITLPFIALLVVPVPALPGHAVSDRLASAVVGLVALGWVLGVRAVAVATGFITDPAAGSVAAGEAAAQQHRRRRERSVERRGIAAVPASSKMALQLAVALGGAFALGRWLFGVHWTWAVVTAYVVIAGNRGRGDVVNKARLRVTGALAGTVVATLIAGLIPAGDDLVLVILFGVMSIAVWLRQRSYAFWAAGVTAILSLLYGYYGQAGDGQLAHRLLGILVGSGLAVGCSWFLLPVRSRDVFRRDWADTLAAASGVLKALRETPDDRAAVSDAQERFRHAGTRLTGLEPTWKLHRRFRPRVEHPADLISVGADLRVRIAELVEMEPEELAAHRGELIGLAREIGAMRKRLRQAAGEKRQESSEDASWKRASRRHSR